MRKVLRPLVNEWCEAHWQLLRAIVYGMFTWQQVASHRDYTGTIWLVMVGEKIFYSRGIT